MDQTLKKQITQTMMLAGDFLTASKKCALSELFLSFDSRTRCVRAQTKMKTQWKARETRKR